MFVSKADLARIFFAFSPISAKKNPKRPEDRKNYEQNQSMYIEIYKKDSQNYEQSTSKRSPPMIPFKWQGMPVDI